jgi:hypothetical protein
VKAFKNGMREGEEGENNNNFPKLPTDKDAA